MRLLGQYTRAVADLQAGFPAAENALEQQVVSAVRDLLSSQLAPLRSSLSSLSDKLAGLPTHSDSDCEQRVSNAVNGAVRDAEQRLRAAVQGVERGWAGELARAQDEARAEIRALKERFGEAERRAESEKARADGLEERVGKVEGEVSMLRRLIEERVRCALCAPSEVNIHGPRTFTDRHAHSASRTDAPRSRSHRRRSPQPRQIQPATARRALACTFSPSRVGIHVNRQPASDHFVRFTRFIASSQTAPPTLSEQRVAGDRSGSVDRCA